MPRLAGISILCVGGLTQLICNTPAVSATPSQQIMGVFSDPVYIGNIYNTPTIGGHTYYDNTLSAPATTTISGGGSTLTWGTNPTPPIGTNYSTLTFTGATVPFQDQSTPIQLGTITYTNGTSSLDSIIFGATLTFSLNGVTLGSDQLIITTTSNQSSGTYLTQAQAELDADYVNLCGLSSTICNTAIQAYENTQGMNGVPFSTPIVAALYGTYEVDPGINLTDVTYQSGDGVVGDRTPEGAIPEASTWAMMAMGFLALGSFGYRASRRSAA